MKYFLILCFIFFLSCKSSNDNSTDFDLDKEIDSKIKQLGWVEVYKNDENFRFLLDYNSIFEVNGLRKFWIKTIPDDPQNLEKDSSQKFDEALILGILNCESRQYTLAEAQIYFEDKNIETEKFNKNDLDWENVKPDSVSWTLYKRVCSYPIE